MIEQLVGLRGKIETLKRDMNELNNSYIRRLTEVKEMYKNKSENIKQETLARYNNTISDFDVQVEQVKIRYNDMLNEYRAGTDKSIAWKRGEVDKIYNEKITNLLQLEAKRGYIMDKIQGLGLNLNPVPVDMRNIEQKIDYSLSLIPQLEDIELYKMKSVPNRLLDWSPLYLKSSNPDVIRTGALMNIVSIFLVWFLLTDFIVYYLCAFTGYVLVSNFKSYKKLANLKSYMFPVVDNITDIKSFIKKSLEKDLLNPHIESCMMKLADYKSSIESKRADEINNIHTKKQEFVNAYNLNDSISRTEIDLKNECEQELKSLTEKQETNMNNMAKDLKETEATYGKLYKEFSEGLSTPDYFNNLKCDSKTLNLDNMHVGYEPQDYGLGLKIPKFADLPNESVLLLHTTEQDAVLLQNFMKYMSTQILAKMDCDSLNVNILDGLSFGGGLSELITEAKYVQGFYSEEEIEDILGKQITDFNIMAKGELSKYKSLNLFNEARMSTNSATRPYHLNLIQNVDMKNDSLSKLYTISKRTGIYNLVLVDYNSLLNDKKDAVEKRYMEELEKFKIKVTVVGDNLINVLYHMDECEYNTTFRYYPYSDDTFRQLSKELDRIKKEKAMNIITSQEFIKDLTGGKRWHKNTVNGVEIYLGYKDGDRTKQIPIVLGDETVHGLMVGNTGMGKSNTVNHIIDGWKKMYSPSELEIYYGDFKKVEGAKYVEPYKLAHATAISCTRDADYTMSIFKELNEEMERREKLLVKYNVGKFSELREVLDRTGEVFPRIVFLVDEFQQMFQINDDVTAMAKYYIERFGRLARAVGIHLFFTSQDMDKTVDDSVLSLFRVRIALPCSKEISKRVLGNGAAGEDAFQKKGNCMVNMTGGAVENNIYFRVPYISTEYLHEGNREALEYARINNLYYRDCVVYKEDDILEEEHLLRTFSKVKDFSKRPEVLLGSKTVFSRKESPTFLSLQKGMDNNNILIVSQGKSRRLGLLKTVLHSLSMKENVKCVYGKMDDLNDEFVKVEDYLDVVRTFGKKSIDEFIESFLNTYKNRQQLVNQGKSLDEESTVIMLLNDANKAPGFGVDIDRALLKELKGYMLDASAYKIHFIAVTTEVLGFENILSAFDHVLVGNLADNDTFVIDRGCKGLIPQLGMYVNPNKKRKFKFKLYDFKIPNDEAETEELDLDETA